MKLNGNVHFLLGDTLFSLLWFRTRYFFLHWSNQIQTKNVCLSSRFIRLHRFVDFHHWAYKPTNSRCCFLFFDEMYVWVCCHFRKVVQKCFVSVNFCLIGFLWFFFLLCCGMNKDQSINNVYSNNNVKCIWIHYL